MVWGERLGEAFAGGARDDFGARKNLGESGLLDWIGSRSVVQDRTAKIV